MAGTILPRQEGDYWRVRVRRPAQGVKIDERFHTERDAQRYIDSTVLPVLNKGEIPLTTNSARLTFQQLTQRYLAGPMLDSAGERELKPTSQKERRGRIKVLVKIFGEVRLSNLKPPLIERHLDAQGWSRNNRQKYEVTLNRLFEWARTEPGGKVMPANPMQGVTRSSGSSRKLKRVYSDSEWKALLAAADNEILPLGIFLRLARATGFRKSELCALLWEDVKPVSRPGLAASVYVPDSKSGSPRKAFISDSVYQLLLAHGQQNRRADEPRVFPHTFDDAFRRARTAAGIDGFDRNGEALTIHAVRRTFATTLGKHGATLAQMRAAGGWKTAEQAMRYMQVDDDLAAEAALLSGDHDGFL